MDALKRLLSNYGGTLSFHDRQTLTFILDLDGQLSILRLNPFFFGSSAAQYYSAIKSDLKSSLFVTPKEIYILKQYQNDQMLRTLRNFPLSLSAVQLHSQGGEDGYPVDSGDLYDPRFFLFSLYHLLSPDKAVNSNQVIKGHGLSMALVATSSEDSAMRNLGYLVIDRLFYHLEGSKAVVVTYFWIHFINMFRATMTSPNQRMPFLLTSLLVRIIEILETPTENMYEYLKDFVTSKPKFDPHHVCSLLKILLTSKEIDWKKIQKSVLHLLASSVRDEVDFSYCRNLVFYILSMYSSPWCDSSDRGLILKFIGNCAKIPEALEIMKIEFGLSVWLTNMSIMFNSGDQPTADLMDIIDLTG